MTSILWTLFVRLINVQIMYVIKTSRFVRSKNVHNTTFMFWMLFVRLINVQIRYVTKTYIFVRNKNVHNMTFMFWMLFIRLIHVQIKYVTKTSSVVRNTDVFAVFDNEANALKFLNYINAQYPNVKFTMVKEMNWKLTFPDILVKWNL